MDNEIDRKINVTVILFLLVQNRHQLSLKPEIVLSSNIFEFNNNLYRQEIGTAMGTSSAPTYANILMGEIDEKLKNLALSLTVSNPISLYNRFIDDIFTI